VEGRPSLLKFFNDIVQHKPTRRGMLNPHYVKIPEKNFSNRINNLQSKLAQIRKASPVHFVKNDLMKKHISTLKKGNKTQLFRKK